MEWGSFLGGVNVLYGVVKDGLALPILPVLPPSTFLYLLPLSP